MDERETIQNRLKSRVLVAVKEGDEGNVGGRTKDDDAQKLLIHAPLAFRGSAVVYAQSFRGDESFQPTSSLIPLSKSM
jgi:hypothetical protein